MSTQKIATSVCRHSVTTERQCIECRIELARLRLDQIAKDKSKAAFYERDMHEADIRILTKMLAEGKVHL